MFIKYYRYGVKSPDSFFLLKKVAGVCTMGVSGRLNR